MGQRYPQPDNEDAFEQMCLRFYRKLWKNESLQLYAKRGENQEGVDIHDPACLRPIRAVQCKHHEPTKTLPPAEIDEEVRKAEDSKIPIEIYVIATTAKKTKNAQDKVVELNSRPEPERKFTIELHFWEDICERLGEFTRVQAEFIVGGHDAGADLIASILNDTQVASIASRVLSATIVDIPAGAFSEIEQLLNERKFDTARHELDKLPSREKQTTLSKTDQYMVVRLRAKLALETGDFASASALFLEAYDLQPELDQAKQNQVLAYGLKLDSKRAFELARDYVAAGLATPVMLCRLIESATTLEQITEHLALIDPFRSTNEDINVALCHKFLQFGEFESAADAAEQAIKIVPDSPHAHFAKGITAHNAVLKGHWQSRKANLQEALHHYNAAAEAARKQNYPNLIPEVLINRGAVNALSGDESAAAGDYRAAVDAANDPAAYAACAVTFFLHRLDFANARELLPSLNDGNDEGKFLRTLTEFHSSEEQKTRYQCLEELRRLADKDWSRAIECRFHCVQFALLIKDPAFARSCITERFQADHPFQAYTALAWIALESDDKQLAAEYAGKALDQSADKAHFQELRLLADIHAKLKQHEKALILLEQVATPGVLNDDSKQLIRFAEHLERHDLLLRLCRELRATGEQDDELRRLEIQLLARYAPEQGFALVDDFIRVSPAPAYFVAFKNLLAIRLNRNEFLQLEPSRLPTPKDLLPTEARLVILPYVAAEKYDDALRFLYSQLREHFDDHQAHGQFIYFFLMNGEKTSLRVAPAKVDEHCAVSLEVEGGRKRWVVLEGDAPIPSRSEFSGNSDLGKRLIGREVGETIELPGSLVGAENAIIREIQTKYVRAFQDCLKRFQERFPETPLLQEFHVGSGDDFDPSAIIESLKQRREYSEKCLALYKSEPCPLYLLASRLGINELDAVKALAQHPTAAVKCCQTTPHDFERTARDGLPAQTIVLDISAITTLTLLDGWSLLGSQKQYLVSQSTKEHVEEWLAEAKEEVAREGGHISITDDGQLSFQEATEEQRKARIIEFHNIVQMLATHCQCKSSEGVANLPPDKRKTYEEVLGFHNLEAMSLARDESAVLWSDDLICAFIAKEEFNTKSVWTQLVLSTLVDTGAIASDDYDLASAKLASWNFTTIIWNAQTIISAGKYAHWDPHQWPFKQCIQLIKASAMKLRSKARVALETLRLLRGSSCSDLRQSPIIQAILTAVHNRLAVIWMYQHLDEAFSVDPLSVAFLRPEFEFWLRSKPI